MNNIEKFSITLRHSLWLDQANWLWDKVRPLYEKIVALLGRNGLERTINSTDQILILPRFRGVAETYEPEVWKHLMAQVRTGDIVADVGAYIGLYTIALAKRVGPSGKVVAFEPDPESFKALKAHVELNTVHNYVDLIPAAVGAQKGAVSFESGRASESHITHVPAVGTQVVQCLCLDAMFSDKQLDILKIDVEGYEEEVLKGGINLLKDKRRSPRVIYIEVHPYTWSVIGTTSESLLSFLAKCNYRVLHLDGLPVKHIEHWGEVIAHKEP